MAEFKKTGYKDSRAPTAEDIQRQDITLRWVELINATAMLERRIVCGEGSMSKALGYFLEKFYSFFYATQFYVDDAPRKAVEKLFLEMEGGKIKVGALIATANMYVRECYRKGMFLPEEIVAEEGEFEGG